MTREFRLMLADPELVERDVHRPAGVSAAVRAARGRA